MWARKSETCPACSFLIHLLSFRSSSSPASAKSVAARARRKPGRGSSSPSEWAALTDLRRPLRQRLRRRSAAAVVAERARGTRRAARRAAKLNVRRALLTGAFGRKHRLSDANLAIFAGVEARLNDVARSTLGRISGVREGTGAVAAAILRAQPNRCRCTRDLAATEAVTAVRCQRTAEVETRLRLRRLQLGAALIGPWVLLLNLI